MNLKCLIGLHKYHSTLLKSGTEYFKKCSKCGHIHIIDNEEVEQKFNNDCNKLQILYDLARHNIKCHNKELAKEIFEEFDHIYDKFKKVYLYYHNVQKLYNLNNEVNKYRKSKY